MRIYTNADLLPRDISASPFSSAKYQITLPNPLTLGYTTNRWNPRDSRTLEKHPSVTDKHSTVELLLSFKT